jgi:hypothetical protein
VTTTPVRKPSSSSGDIAVFDACGEDRKFDQTAIGSIVMRQS